MRALAHCALVALLPAVLGPSAASTKTLSVAICTGEGQVRTVELPLQDPGAVPAPCCTKGCHASSSRKKPARQN